MVVQRPRNSSAGLRAARRSALTPHSRRLTPAEVSAHWFRRGRDFVDQIHDTFADFPQPAPDGLYLLTQVEEFFARFHGIRVVDSSLLEREREEALRAARGH